MQRSLLWIVAATLLAALASHPARAQEQPIPGTGVWILPAGGDPDNASIQLPQIQPGQVRRIRIDASDLIGGRVPGPTTAQDPTKAPALDPATAGPALRIWSHAQRGMQDVWFRRAIGLPAAPKRATLVFSCDNVATVFVNGKRLAHCTSWETLTAIDVTRLLQKGDNLIAIHAKNTGSCAALAAWLVWTDGDGEDHELVTDASWRYSETEEEGWNAIDFDADDWQAANATLPTPYGKNVYAGTPSPLRFENALSAPAAEIEAALQRLRAARTPEAAQKALDAIDRAVMNTRAALWRQQAGRKKR